MDYTFFNGLLSGLPTIVYSETVSFWTKGSLEMIVSSRRPPPALTSHTANFESSSFFGWTFHFDRVTGASSLLPDYLSLISFSISSNDFFGVKFLSALAYKRSSGRFSTSCLCFSGLSKSSSSSRFISSRFLLIETGYFPLTSSSCVCNYEESFWPNFLAYMA